MNWFEKLVGFSEESPDQVRANLEWGGVKLRSKVNGQSFRCGELETPSLARIDHQKAVGLN